MLQIKKKSQLIQCKYNLRLLFRRRGIESQYHIRKQKTSSIILRSPKHFNIGKQKIINLNFKTPDLSYASIHNFFLHTLFISQTTLYKLLVKRIKTTPVLGVSSMRVSVKTQFKLRWLGI